MEREVRQPLAFYAEASKVANLPALPRPLTGIERTMLQAAEFYVTLIRQQLQGTGTVTITLDLKDHQIKTVRGGVNGPREEV